jgi:hypothetical protein
MADLQTPAGPSRPAVAATAYNMADALSYLVRVANGAGLSGIAGHLSAVRRQVLDVARTYGGEDVNTSSDHAKYNTHHH